MRPGRLLISGLGCLAVLSPPYLLCQTAGESGKAIIPAEIAPESYKPIWVRSPFSAIATSPDGGNSGEWTLTGLLRDGDRPIVFLVNRQSQEHLTVTDKPNGKGFSVESIDSRTNLLQSSARIKTSGETLVVKFDPSVMAAASAPAASTAQPASPPNQFSPTPSTFSPPPGTISAPTPTIQRIIVPSTTIPNPLPNTPPLAK